MKKFFVVSLALASSMSFAADIDYSRCSMLGGAQFDHDGRVVSTPFQTIKSQSVVGNKEHVVFETPGFNGKKTQMIVDIERDAQGRPVKVTSGGERPSEQMLRDYRNSMVDGAVMSASFSSGIDEDGRRTNFMSQEPTYWVKKKNPQASANSQNDKSMGPFGRIDPNYEMVPLSRLSREQASEVGIQNADELKRLRSQWKKDRKTTQRLRDSYRQVVERSSLVIPLGMEMEMDIQDGVCVPKSMSSRFYNSQSGQVNTYQFSSRENCEKINNVYRRHQEKVNNCRTANTEIYNDYVKEMGFDKTMGGSDTGGTGGAVHGGFGGGYLAGGVGIAGGMGGGYGMGMGMVGMGGMYGGMGMFPGAMMGADTNSLSMLQTMCEWNYRTQQNNNPRGSATSGATGGAASTQQ